jgi:hypothetical protein
MGLEVDLAKFFDTVDHRQMRELLSRRVQDGVITRLIAKWLKAGVMENGNVSYPEEGTPQGGVISPLLSNIYLHEVLDKWFVESVQPACGGRTFMVRFADDFVMGFERLEDVRKVQRVIAKRFARFGLKINAGRRGWCASGGRRVVVEVPGADPGPSISLASPIIGGGPGTATCGEGQDRRRAVPTGAGQDQGVGVGKPPSALEGTAARDQREVARPRRLLRSHRELSHAFTAAVRGGEAVAQVAAAPQPWQQPNWKKFQAMLRTFPLLPAKIVHSKL